jgi:hypothetical protein
MASKNQVGGGNRASSRKVASSQQLPSTSAPSQVPHIDRLLGMSIMIMDAAMFHKLMTNAVPMLSSFEKEWIQADFRADTCVQLGADSFSLELRSQFPAMTLVVRAQVVEVLRGKVRLEFEAGGSSITQELFNFLSKTLLLYPCPFHKLNNSLFNRQRILETSSSADLNLHCLQTHLSKICFLQLPLRQRI